MERGPVLACVKALRAASTRQRAGFGLDSGAAPAVVKHLSPARSETGSRSSAWSSVVQQSNIE